VDYTALLGRDVLSVALDANADAAVTYSGAALTVGSDRLAPAVEDYALAAGRAVEVGTADGGVLCRAM